MKTLKSLALVIVATVLVAGCACNKCCAKKDAAAACTHGHQCCADAKTDCAHCATCKTH